MTCCSPRIWRPWMRPPCSPQAGAFLSSTLMKTSAIFLRGAWAGTGWGWDSEQPRLLRGHWRGLQDQDRRYVNTRDSARGLHSFSSNTQGRCGDVITDQECQHIFSWPASLLGNLDTDESEAKSEDDDASTPRGETGPPWSTERSRRRWASSSSSREEEEAQTILTPYYCRY